jgi:hypothetical protein
VETQEKIMTKNNEALPVLTLAQQKPPQSENWWNYLNDLKNSFQVVDSFQRAIAGECLGWIDLVRILPQLGLKDLISEDFTSLKFWGLITPAENISENAKRIDRSEGFYTETTTHYKIVRGAWEIIAEDICNDAPWQCGGNSSQVRKVLSFYIRFIGYKD